MFAATTKNETPLITMFYVEFNINMMATKDNIMATKAGKNLGN